jgi:hypothetical protein
LRSTRQINNCETHTCGALLRGRERIIPYAMSDSATSFATVPLDELLAAMGRIEAANIDFNPHV